MKKIALLLTVLICCFSCSDNNHTERDKNADTTIYDLFPDYDSYSSLYMSGYVKLESISTKELKQYSFDEAISILKETNPKWKIPNAAPYLYNEYFGVIRLILSNEVCYKEALALYPNYVYYECLQKKNLFELENKSTKELKTFEVNYAEKLLRNPNEEWKIPKGAPYVLDSGTTIGLRLIHISEICHALS